jgi:Domain of unknown function (DUF3472)/Domain of unknown function (DUF5077)
MVLQVKGFLVLICSLLMTGVFSLSSHGQDLFIPLAGNTWVVNNTRDKIDHTGLHKWQDPQTALGTFFKVNRPGNLTLAIIGHVAAGKSKLKFTLNNQSLTLDLTNTTKDTLYIGQFDILKAGYQQVVMQGISKTAADFANIKGFLVSGTVVDEKTVYVKDDFYWGRRGPSVHLRYDIPATASEVVWFYNEITVPESEDVIGSYFMANGFSEGYFGIQVNSAVERRILFSVWSPYKTDDPQTIPDDQKIKLLAKGKDVYTGEFGNEGAGGQSYLRYSWQAGNTYRFLLKGEPADNNATDYTAFFYAPEIEEWLLIASFRRPKTSTYLKHLHSFLENFVTETGYLSRKLFYSNQWLYDTNGQWHELTGATFTADATARKGARLDYSGGVEGDRFFLKNCGFFNNSLQIGSKLKRKPSGIPPQINFAALPH